MKTKTISTTVIMLVLMLFITACGGAAVPAAPASEAQPPADSEAPAEAAAPVKDPAPTEVPPPVPCNIVFDSDRDGNREIYLMGPDGKDQVNLSNNPADDFDPAISADGSQIAFVSNREDGKEGGQFIYVMNADGSNVRQLTYENWSDWPNWSNDGSQITYTSNDDIFIIKSDGSGQSVNLTNSPEKDGRSSWSPDGTQIAWVSGYENNSNILVMNADGSHVKQITDNGQQSDVKWTVDGRLFAGWGWKDQEQTCNNCIFDADGSNILDAGGKGELQRFMPFWTLAGDRVECVSANFNTPDNEIFLVGEVFPDIFLNLTNNPADDRNPDWPANCGPAVPPEKEVEQPEPIVALGDWVIGYKKPENQQKAAELLKACQELQIECIEGESLSKLAEKNVDAIVYPSNNWDVLGSWPQIHDVAQKGIPLIVLDAETTEPGVYNLSNESDSVLSGLEWMFKEMGGEGAFVYFNFGQNDVHQALIDETLKDYPGITATSLPASFEGESFTEESLAALVKSGSSPKAIWSDNRLADMFWMLKNIQVKDPPAILCEPKQDMFQAWRDLKGEKPSFKCFSTINPGGTAYEGIYVAFFILNGDKIDPAALGGEAGNTFIYDYPQITNDNLEEWLGKIDSFRKSDWDTLEIPPMTPGQIREKWFLE